jgi:hypothetical protein
MRDYFEEEDNRRKDLIHDTLMKVCEEGEKQLGVRVVLFYGLMEETKEGLKTTSGWYGRGSRYEKIGILEDLKDSFLK